jgi:hypothetical protein
VLAGAPAKSGMRKQASPVPILHIHHPRPEDRFYAPHCPWTRGGSPVRETCSPGSVRAAR